MPEANTQTLPKVGEDFLDQSNMRIGKIHKIARSSPNLKSPIIIFLSFNKTLAAVPLHRIEKSSRGDFWTFKEEEKKEYSVWCETTAPKGGFNNPGAFKEAVSVKMTLHTAEAIAKLLKAENPGTDFFTSVGTPLSYNL